MPKITILADLLGAGHVEQFDRYPEFNVLVLAGQGEDLHRLDRTQRVDDVPYHHLGGRGARCNANYLDVMQPFPLYFAAVGYQMGWDPGFHAYFAQSVGIGAVLGSDHKNDIDQLG